MTLVRAGLRNSTGQSQRYRDRSKWAMVVEEVSQCIFEDLLCASTILGTAESVVNKKNNKIFKEYMF